MVKSFLQFGVIQKVRSLRGGGRHWKAIKNEQGKGVLAYVDVRFFRKKC